MITTLGIAIWIIYAKQGIDVLTNMARYVTLLLRPV